MSGDLSCDLCGGPGAKMAVRRWELRELIESLGGPSSESGRYYVREVDVRAKICPRCVWRRRRREIWSVGALIVANAAILILAWAMDFRLGYPEVSRWLFFVGVLGAFLSLFGVVHAIANGRESAVATIIIGEEVRRRKKTKLCELCGAAGTTSIVFTPTEGDLEKLTVGQQLLSSHRTDLSARVVGYRCEGHVAGFTPPFHAVPLAAEPHLPKG